MTDLLYPSSEQDFAIIPNDVLARIEVILVNPSHPGNVGAVARAMKVMGCRYLHLVAPKLEAVSTHPDAVALASGAQDVLETVQYHETLACALQPFSWAVALSARRRDLAPTYQSPRGATQEMVAYLKTQPQARLAMVFGAERTGLSSEDVLLCQRYCQIPTNPDYASLNLAQAVQLMVYECRVHAFDLMHDDMPKPRLATQGEQQQFLQHLEAGLVQIGFLDPDHPKRLMPRLQRLFARSGIEDEEMSILRGICRAMCESNRDFKHRK